MATDAAVGEALRIGRIGGPLQRTLESLRQALSENLIVVEFNQLVGVHKVGGAVDSALVAVLEGLSDGEGTVDVEALGTEGNAPLVVERAASVVVSFGVDVLSCVGIM